MSDVEDEEQEPLSQSLRRDATTTKLVRVFLAVAAEELGFAEELIRHLKPGLLQVWHRGKLQAGEHRLAKVRKHLGEAQIFVIFVSPALMSSEERFEDVDSAMDRYQQEEVPVLPVLLRSYDLEAELLGSLQALPRSGEPVAYRLERDQAWVEIARAIRQEAERIQRHLSGPSQSGAYELRPKKDAEPNDEPSIDASG